MPNLFKNISASVIETFETNVNLINNVSAQIGYGGSLGCGSNSYISVYGFEAFIQDYTQVSKSIDLVKPTSFGLVNNSEIITLVISGESTTYQTRIYPQNILDCVKNKVINIINTSSNICTFSEPLFGMSGATKIITGITSANTNVHVITTATTINVGVIFTANTNSFTANSAEFKYEIYKYNSIFSAFTNNRIYNIESISQTAFTTTTMLISGIPITYSAITQNIPISGLSIDGDYLIKGFYEYESCNDYLSRLGVLYDTSLYKSGTTYGYYNPSTDYYFIAMTAADIPIFRGINQTSLGASALHQQVILPENSQTVFAISDNVVGDFLVTLNGLVLANNYDYTASGFNITLTAETESTDILTIIFTSNGNNGITTDIIDVNVVISSGTTNNQGNNDVYFNTTTSKYELFTSLNPIEYNNIIVMINGVTLANNIDYYQSISDPRRIILEGNLLVGDIITIAYFAYAEINGGISTNTPSIGWDIDTAPQLINGFFVVEVANSNTFSTILFTASTPYIIGQTSYNTNITITGNSGTEYYYRVKNDKQYVSLTGDIIESIRYSEPVKITIESNAINSY